MQVADNSHIKRTKSVKNFLVKWLPSYALTPLICIFLLNTFVYSGTALLTKHRFHHDLTMSVDRMVPLLPGFVWIYLLAFPFWVIGYILVIQRGKDMFMRFVATDITIHLICMAIFLLLPTTNIRPVVTGSGFSEKILALVYALDGKGHPSNLFPSIHCFVSWLCWRGIKGCREIPRWYQRFSLVFAVLVIISTQVLKQHYLVDAVMAVLLVEVVWHFYQKNDRHRWAVRLFDSLGYISKRFVLTGGTR